MELFYALPQSEQAQYWANLRHRIDRERAAKFKRAQKTALPEDVDAKLRQIPATVYVRAITGCEIEDRKRICCPLPDHEDTSFDFHAEGWRWYCFGCNRGHGIYDFASFAWRIPTHGQAFKEVQQRLYELLL